RLTRVRTAGRTGRRATPRLRRRLVLEEMELRIVPTVTFSPTTLPNWTVNQPGYSQTITESGLNPLFASFSSSGAVPTGLTLTDNGNGTATLFGTPTVANTFNFTISAAGLGN